MKKSGFRSILVVFLVIFLSTSAAAAELLVPVGQAVGLELESDGLSVAGFDEALGTGAQSAGLRVGDLIVKADGNPVNRAKDLQNAVSHCKTGLILTVLRDGQEVNLTVQPARADGSQRLGIYVREGIAGIGTVTYYQPESGAFGALGHGISDSQGNLLPLRSGRVLGAEVVSVKKGRVGEPGQLQGAFQADNPMGELLRNTGFGIFGSAEDGWPGTPLPAAESSEIHTGPAVILSNIQGTQVQEYAVEIQKLYPGDHAQGRNLLIHVTDPALLEATGGIVQGMSGSPILQDGKLIGAVTHVLVNDPTTGYGIFIENMLDAAA